MGGRFFSGFWEKRPDFFIRQGEIPENSENLVAYIYAMGNGNIFKEAAMKQTSNYQLNQWEMTDRIQMEDFNADNQKIEAALDGLKGLCNAQAYIMPYTGTGEDGPKVFTFPHQPMFVTIQGNNTWMCGVRGISNCHGRMGANTYFDAQLVWNDKALSVGSSTQSSGYCCNAINVQYILFAVLDANT